MATTSSHCLYVGGSITHRQASSRLYHFFSPGMLSRAAFLPSAVDPSFLTPARPHLPWLAAHCFMCQSTASPGTGQGCAKVLRLSVTIWAFGNFTAHIVATRRCSRWLTPGPRGRLLCHKNSCHGCTAHIKTGSGLQEPKLENHVRSEQGRTRDRLRNLTTGGCQLCWRALDGAAPVSTEASTVLRTQVS